MIHSLWLLLRGRGGGSGHNVGGTGFYLFLFCLFIFVCVYLLNVSCFVLRGQCQVKIPFMLMHDFSKCRFAIDTEQNQRVINSPDTEFCRKLKGG